MNSILQGWSPEADCFILGPAAPLVFALIVCVRCGEDRLPASLQPTKPKKCKSNRTIPHQSTQVKCLFNPGKETSGMYTFTFNMYIHKERFRGAFFNASLSSELIDRLQPDGRVCFSPTYVFRKKKDPHWSTTPFTVTCLLFTVRCPLVAASAKSRPLNVGMMPPSPLGYFRNYVRLRRL